MNKPIFGGTDSFKTQNNYKSMLLTAFCRQVTLRSLNRPKRRPWRQTSTLRIMKLTAALLFLFNMSLSARSLSQNITYSGKDVPLEKVFDAIKEQTGFFVISNQEQVKNVK